MRVVVAGEATRVCSARIGNGSGSVCCDYVDVKIDESLPGNAPAAAAHSVGGMARGTRETIIDMARVLAEAGIREDLRQVVALRAERVRTVYAEIGAGIEVDDQHSRAGSLAEFVAAFQNVCPLRTMRTIRTGAPKFAIVIAVVAIGAENLHRHASSQGHPVQIQHIAQQAGLRQRTASGMHHGMAGLAGDGKLRDHIQHVSCRYRANGKVPVNRVRNLSRTRAMAAQAVLVLIGGWIQDR